MRTATAAATCAALLTVAACGGAANGMNSANGTSGGTPATNGTNANAPTANGGSPSAASSTAITQYQDLTSQVQSAAVSYGATMAGPGMTLANCSATQDAYDAQVRPWISQMAQTSGSMDAFMDAHGGNAYADITCVVNAMLQELDAHRLVACTFSTLGGDRTEAARHVGVMTAYAGHLHDRCGQMSGGQYLWGPSAPVCSGTAGGTPTDPLALGQRIFDTGVGTDGQPIARTGGYGMMMTSGCASCHGYDGLGRATMMFTTPDITYANLTDPAGMLDPDGTRGPTYTDDLIRRAVTQGIDAAGDPLSTIMPQWQLSDEDWADLLLFLKSLSPATATAGTGSTPPAGGGTISGSAFMGSVGSGTMTAYAISGGMMATPLGTSAVDASGSFAVAVGNYSGPVMLRLAAGTYTDDATGTTMTMQPGDVMSAVVPSVTAGSATAGVLVTPLSSMAQARAQGMAGGMTDANIAAANAAMASYFSVSDVLHTVPMNPLTPGSGAGASQDGKNYGMTIAAMSEYARTIGMTSSSGIVTAMMDDASDGTFNGMMGSTSISLSGIGAVGGGMMGGTGMMGGSGGMMQPAAGTSGLAAAMTAFIDDASVNRSGVTLADMQSLIAKLTASNGSIQ